MIFVARRVMRFSVCIILVCLYSTNLLIAEEDDAWIFAAAEFSSSVENDPTARLIPMYILQNMPQSLKRNVTPEEQYRYDSALITDELVDLYEDVQAKTLERDSLILAIDNDSDFEKDTTEKENEIIDIQEEIEVKKNEQSSISTEDYAIIEQKVSIWQDNPTRLYDIQEDLKYFYPRDIRALITGNIVYAESFISVTAYITLYPGSVIEIEVQEADTITAIQELSKRLSEKIYASLANKELVEIVFSIKPSESQKDATIHIDGQLIRLQETSTGNKPPNFETTEKNSMLENTDESMLFARINLIEGIHEFYVECPGYEGLSVSYLFSGEQVYNVAIHLRKEDENMLSFSIPSSNGSLFLNTKKMEQAGELQEYVSQENNAEVSTQGFVTVNGFPALGEYISEEGIPTWFLLDTKQNEPMPLNTHSYSFTFEPETKNFSDIIEKNRKRMYNSYAALIVSLPFYFIANGQYINEYNSWASGKTSDANLEKWALARDITMGASIGLGVNFLVQLGLYIYSANAILPEEVTVK